MKSRVVFVSQPGARSGPPQPEGSIEIWTHEVARRLAPASVVRVYRPSALARSTIAHHDGVEYHAVSVVFDRLTTSLHWLFRGTRPSPFSVWHALGYALRVAAGIARFRPDVVHVQNQFPFVRVIRWINRRVPVVLHMHGEWLTGVDRSAVAPALELVDRVVAPSEFVAEAFRRSWPERAADCVRIPNGVDAAWMEQGISPPAGCPEVVFVGRLSPEKGIHDLISAFETVAMCVPDVVLTIIGPVKAVAPMSHLIELSDDPLVCELERFYGQTSYHEVLQAQVPSWLRERVRFVSTMPHEELLDVYRRATVVVNPSLTESFGMSVIEAMATGTPVVATSVGGMTEILAGGVGGVLVPPCNPGRLAGAILDLLADPASRHELGASGRARVAARYTWDLVSQDIGFVYTGIEDGARTKQVIGTRFEQLVGQATRATAADFQGRTLVVAPHPDDETLGCGGTIAALTGAGREVGVVFLTDGSLPGPGDRRTTTEERKAEARRACDLLGVKPVHTWAFELPDGGLSRHETVASDRLADVLDEFSPVRVFVPHQHDGHPDHEAAYRIVRRAAAGRSAPIEVIEYAIWLWNNWPWTPIPMPFNFDRAAVKRSLRAWRQTIETWRRGDVRALDLAFDVQSTAWRKRAALDVYRSQLPSLSTIGRGRFLRWFATSHELFRIDRSVETPGDG